MTRLSTAIGVLLALTAMPSIGTAQEQLDEDERTFALSTRTAETPSDAHPSTGAVRSEESVMIQLTEVMVGAGLLEVGSWSKRTSVPTVQATGMG